MPRKASLSIELLETFIRLLDNGGDAARTARELDLNQPSMSKRMAMLQRAGRVKRAWLVRRGKTWYATDEGQRVLGAVRDIVHRHRKLTQFLGGNEAGLPEVTFACGQRASIGFVLDAVKRFRNQHPEVGFRLSTLRGRARVEGVANGLLDLATVTVDEALIREAARRPVHLETLFEDPLVLVCAAKSEWRDRVEALPEGGLKPKDLAGLPLILPEPDSDVRRQFDRVVREAELRRPLNVVLELGGWPVLLEYVAAGLGVGVAAESACRGAGGVAVVRQLDRKRFAPAQMRLICAAGEDGGPDLSEPAGLFREELRRAADEARKGA